MHDSYDFKEAYLFKAISNVQFSQGKYFWEMNLYTDLITNGVMKVRKYWSRMPNSPDAIVQTRNGYIYVFKGK